MHDKFSLAKNGSVVVANLVEKKIIYFLLVRMCWFDILGHSYRKNLQIKLKTYIFLKSHIIAQNGHNS